MHPVLKELITGLEPDEGDVLVRRVELMESELKHLQEAKPEDIASAKKRGWPPQKLQIVFCLNSFYQRILAPLWASAKSPTAIGSTIPIRYGKTIVFDAKRNAAVDKMGIRFLEICRNFQISQTLLEAQRTSDLIWEINKSTLDSDAKK
jgi:hypothetical protein